MTGGGWIRAIVAGFVAGAFGGLFGVGGGIILIPLLTGWFGATQHQAHGTSLAVVGATALASVAVYALHRNVDVVTAFTVGVASALTARYGARLTTKVSPLNLRRAFALFLVLVAVRLLWKPAAAGAPFVHGGATTIAFDLALGAAVGVLAGFMGIGGGILAVPAFALLLGMPQQLAQGTSLAVILVTAPVGTIEHLRLGNVLVRLVAWLAVGAVAGAVLAANVVQDLPREALTRAFALFQLAMAAQMLWRARGGRPPATPPAGRA